MLRHFCLENFRSFKSDQCFSMISGGKRGWRAKYVHPVGPRGDEQLHAVAAFYGANGAGKSNLFNGLMYLKHLVLTSAAFASRNERLHFDPFIFDGETRGSTTQIEISFIQNNKLFDFRVSFDSERVHYERLEAKELRPRARSRVLYEREFDPASGDDEYHWTFNSSIRGPKETWIESTKKNALFLSTTVLLNSDVFADVYEWFESNLRTISQLHEPTRHFFDQYTAKYCLDSAMNKRIRKFLNAFDLPVDEIKVQKKEGDESWRELIKDEIIDKFEAAEEYEVSFGRRDDQGAMQHIDLLQESSGTQAIFALAGAIIDTIEMGYTVVVDELNTYLHPLVLNHLVRLFHSKKLNRNGAQLIFASHDTSVFGLRSLSKDEIWILDRNRDKSSQISSLADFSPRKEDAVSRHYLSGRYGGTPRLAPTFEGIFDAPWREANDEDEPRLGLIQSAEREET